MLKITIPATELWDELNDKFIQSKEQTLQLEHSLVSISKWESKWNKPFMTKENKTAEETFDYIRCMTTTQNVDPTIYNFLTDDNIKEVEAYIEADMTATKIRKSPGKTNREIITSELIYYWMISMNIPFECQKWHLNRLLTLINVCNIKNTPPKKMNKQELMNRNASLNAARKQALGTGG